MSKNSPLVWIDLEMTGLNPERDLILEIAVIITDNNLNVLHHGPALPIHHHAATLPVMDQWVQKHHTDSGLLQDVEQSTIDTALAQEEVLAVIREHCPPKKSPLCGNSVWQDAAFMRRYMPKIMEYLHYRIIDVSSIKEVVDRWYPHNPKRSFIKKDKHRAMSDIEESIAELKHYRSNFFTYDF